MVVFCDVVASLRFMFWEYSMFVLDKFWICFGKIKGNVLFMFCSCVGHELDCVGKVLDMIGCVLTMIWPLVGND